MQKIKDSVWKLSYSSFLPKQESLREALCVLGNGYFATRACFPEIDRNSFHYPGTYIAGVYNKLSTQIAGKTIQNDDFVNCPNWLPIKFSIDGQNWVVPGKKNIVKFTQSLDIKNGLLNRIYTVKNRVGKITSIEECRLVSMFNPHIAAIRYKITPQNYSGLIKIISSIDGTVENKNVARYSQLNSYHLKFLKSRAQTNIISLIVKTTQSKIKISTSARLKVFKNNKKICPQLAIIRNNAVISQEFVVDLERKSFCVLEKTVAIFTSKDAKVKDAFKASFIEAKRAPNFKQLVGLQKNSWKKLWQESDVRFKSDLFIQKALRLHIFHLLQTASIHNTRIDAGLPARGLHGEAYRGHIFWDELFAMSFFDLHMPAISKSFLLYRFRRLAKARQYASLNGFKGAMFPWQSSSTGVEETQVVHLNPVSGEWGPDYSRIQRHVSFAVAYNIHRYFTISADIDFLSCYGAEMFFDIAKLAASLLKFDSRDKKYHTYGLMGPDEFHEKLPFKKGPGFKDNAYTNILISWLLNTVKSIAEELPENTKRRIFKKLKINDSTIKRWQCQSRKINILINKNGIISQFDGYFKLKELNWQYYRRKYKNIHRMDRILKSEGKSCNDYKVGKQADVLMMFYLFSQEEIEKIFKNLSLGVGKDIVRKNYDYYVKRTSHGSTLSKVVHCYIAHLLGREKEALKWFREVLESDICDSQGGTTSEGIHVGVMGGSIDLLIRAFAGVSFSKEKISINPKLIKNIKALDFKVVYRKYQIAFIVNTKKVSIKVLNKKVGKLNVEFSGKIYSMKKKLILKMNNSKGDKK
ncbi:MAG: glycoside hydrolase family 65 protein [Candidatus Gygaella obscura]|nr:glycoside hydrolase family 65 protein [Candidatus Gygaella obscura]